MSRSGTGSTETAENNKYTRDRLAALLFWEVAREIQTAICVLNWKDVCIFKLLTTLVSFLALLWNLWMLPSTPDFLERWGKKGGNKDGS